MNNLKKYKNFEAKKVDPFEEENWSLGESMDIDPYDEENWDDDQLVMSQEEFDAEKNILLNNLNIMIDRYGQFMENISFSHFRTSGRHFRYLMEIREELQDITPMTQEEKRRLDAIR